MKIVPTHIVVLREQYNAAAISSSTTPSSSTSPRTPSSRSAKRAWTTGFDLANAEFQRLRKQGKLNRERKKLSDKRDDFLMAGDHSELFYWAKDQPLFRGGGQDYDSGEESFEAKFVRFIDRYGEASERFVAAIRRARERKAKWEAERAKEAETATPVVTGKQTVTGEIKSIKSGWNSFNGESQLKLLVRDDRGFKVFGNAPRSIEDQLTENLKALHARLADSREHYFKELLPLRIKFDATLKPSNDDQTFGFFSRPRNANLIND